jgi:HD superfamily phosphohydrolase YqeK
MDKQMSNNILDEILSENNSVIPKKDEDKILQPILDEINYIFDESIKSFVRAILLRASSFWSIPSSFSGKYHPADEHNYGGNVLHTKRVVRAAKIMCESYSLSREDTDIVFAACILHDVTKGIKLDGEDSFHYDPMHPYTVARLVQKCQEDDKNYASESQSSTLFISEEVVQSILRLVRCHLGPWSPVPETIPITYMDMIVHLADNVASKVHYIVDGENVNLERWKTQKDERN